jgi:hypothetical protein
MIVEPGYFNPSWRPNGKLHIADERLIKTYCGRLIGPEWRVREPTLYVYSEWQRFTDKGCSRCFDTGGSDAR